MPGSSSLPTPTPLINPRGPIPGMGWSEGTSPFPQPTCLAEFKQIKSIRCLPLEEGQAVLQLGIEGAPQVSISENAGHACSGQPGHGFPGC